MKKSLIALLAIVLAFFAIDAVAELQQNKALVYCPTSDATGCSAIVAALNTQFKDGVVRAYDGTNGTVDLRAMSQSDIASYAVVVIPSLADIDDQHPYDVLRNQQVALKLRAALHGVVLVYSGQPDVGSRNRAEKNALIQELATSAAERSHGATGLLTFLDQSDDAPFSWLEPVAGARVGVSKNPHIYSSLRKNEQIAQNVLSSDVPTGYRGIASFGLVLLPNSIAEVVARGDDGAALLVAFDNFTHAAFSMDMSLDTLPRISTDKEDYAPGEVVNISGTGWLPGETVQMTLTEHGDDDPPSTLTAVADSTGSFMNTEFTPNIGDVGVQFTLDAVGQTSGRKASTAFSDGAINGSSSTITTYLATCPGTAVTSFSQTDAVCASVFVNVSANAQPTDFTVRWYNNGVEVTGFRTGGTIPANTDHFTATATKTPGATSSTNWSIRLCQNTMTTTDCPPSQNKKEVFFTVASAKTAVTLAVGPTTATYDGSQKPVAVAVSSPSGFTGYTVSYTGTGATTYGPSATAPTNAGTYSATASLNDPSSFDFSGGNTTGTLTINQASSAVTVTCPNTSQTYTGSAQTPCTASVAGAGGLSQSLTVSYTNNTNVGTAGASASFAGDANHTASNNTGSFAIGQASSSVSVTCPASPLTYTGSAQEPCTAQVTGVGGLSQPVTVSYTNNTAVGTAGASASYAGDTNYSASSNSGSFSIAQASSSVTVVCPNTPQTYTGSAQSPCTASVSGPGLSQSLTVDYTNNTNVGTAGASATYAGDSNVSGSSNTGSFSISQASSSVSVTCPVTPQPYTGSAQSPCTAAATGPGLNQPLTVDYTNNTDVGTAGASATFAGNTNISGSSNTASFTIGQAASTTVVSCPAATQPYTGLAQTPCTASVTGAGGLSESLTVNYGSNVDVGSATASASWPGDANHSGSSDNGGFTIGKASSSVAVTCPNTSQPYTGSPQEPCSATVTGVGGLNESVSVSYSGNTNVGSATASASFGGDGNHLGSSNSANFSISAASSVVSITCPTSPLTYNGSAQTPCSASVSGVGGLSSSVSVSYSDNTDAGTANASASFAGDANHSGSSNSATFTIGQAGSSVAVTCPATPQTYTGSAQQPCSAQVTGVGGLSQSVSVSYTNNTDVGTAGASATFTGGGNWTGSSNTGSFTISQAASNVTVTCPTSPVTYTGSALSPCTATATGAGNLNQSVSVDYTNNIDVGTAGASASFAGDGNHTGSNGSGSFSIGQASSTTVVTCPNTPQPYTGSAQTPCSATVTGAGSLSQSLTVVYGSNTAVGSATASASWPGDGNHTGSSDNGGFTISKAASSVAVTCPGTPQTYTGSAQSPCTAAVSGVGGLSQSLSVSYSNNTDVGVATGSASFGGDDNHLGSSNSATFSISKASSSVAVTCPNSPVTYSGSAQEPCTASASGAGSLSVGGLTVSYTDNTDAGTAHASAAYAGDANHDGSSGTGSFSIDKAGSAVTVTCPATPVTYNGSAQTPCSAAATGVGGLNQSLSVSYSNNTNVGTAGASASFAGDANHTGSNNTGSFAIQKADQAITFGALGGKTYGDAAFNVSATAPLTVAFSSTTPTVCTVSGTSVTIVAAGTCTVRASQPGDANYNAAADVDHSFTVDKKSASVSAVANSKTFGSSDPSLGTTYSGFVAGDVGTGKITFSAARTTGETVAGGPYTITPSAADGSSGLLANYNVSYNTAAFTINKYSENGTVTVSPTSQAYASNVTFTATLPAPVVGGETAAAAAQFYVGTQLMGQGTVTGGVATLTTPLTETVAGQLAPGSGKVVKAVFQSIGDDFTLNQPTTSLTITPKTTIEPASGWYSGQNVFWTPNTTSSAATLTLSATIKDSCLDPSVPAGYAVCGDITKARVSFGTKDGSGNFVPLSGASNLPVGRIADGIGTANTTLQYNLQNNQNSASIVLYARVEGYYNNTSWINDPTMIEISRPTIGNEMKILGTFANTNAAGTLTPTGATGVWSDITYTNKGTNPQGDLSMTLHGTGNHLFQIKTNAIQTLNVDAVKGTASFTAKASIQDLTSGASVDGGALVQVNVTKATGTSFGTITVQVTSSKNGAVWFINPVMLTKTTAPTAMATGTININ